MVDRDLAFRPEEPPVFMGHYWVPPDSPKIPLAPNVAVLDFSVANGGDLVAYRWDGEAVLEAGKFVTVTQEGILM